MASKSGVAQLVKNARQIRGLTQGQFGEELGCGQSLLSRYERGLVDPPGDIVMQCVNITRGDPPALSAADVAQLVEARLASPAHAKLCSAIGALIQSMPSMPAAKARIAKHKGK